MSLASAAQSLLSLIPDRGTKEHKTELESMASTDDEPKDPQSLALEESSEIAEENIALIKKLAEDIQKECSNVASLGEFATQAEPTQKHAEARDLTSKQQNVERQRDKLLLKIQQVEDSNLQLNKIQALAQKVHLKQDRPQPQPEPAQEFSRDK